MLRSRWKELAAAAVIVLLNTYVVLNVTGVGYEPFSWQAFAQVYETQAADCDGDAIADEDELGFGGACTCSQCRPLPQQDPNCQVCTFNESGCFYSTFSGKIFAGGRISVSGTGVLNDDGSDGCFQYVGTDRGVVTITIEAVPDGCVLNSACPDLAPPPFAAPAGPVVALGNLPSLVDPSRLTAPGCTPWYTQIDLSDPDAAGVIGNNIPLICENAPAPVLSPWGWVAATLLLLGVGFATLRTRSRRA